MPTATGGGASPIPATNMQTGAASTTAANGISTPTTPTLSSLYPTTPAAGTFAASTGAASTTGTAPTANASDVNQLAGINNGMINPGDATNAASQLNAITASGSPYIQQAEQQGMLSAAARGLQNSSLGAGAAEAAAVQAAAPLAEQNAGAATQGALQNSQLNTQANEFNASQQNANQQLNAQLQTQQTQFNASQTQAAAATNAQAQNAFQQQTQQTIAALNQQFLSGSQAQTLASIQGQYSQLIAQNQSAASLYSTMLTGINASLSNPNIPAQRAGDAINADVALMSTSLKMLNELNGGGPAALPPGSTNAVSMV